MTDNRTTELREKLDERGIIFATDDYATSKTTMWTTQNGGWIFDCDYMEPLNEKSGTIGAKTELMIYGYTPEQAIAATLGSEINGEMSDGYHTFNELYHHRAVLFSVIVRDHRELAWKAMKHHDGTMYDGMFIVGIETPKGQATYHYDLDPYWEMFDCEEREFAPKWDGHTPDEAIARIAELWSGTLTAEQVREAVMSADRWEKPMGNTGLTNTHLIIRDDGWQAIADELNAERHVETCRITASSTDGLCSDNPRQYFELSCGHSFTINGLDAPVACAVCGKVVKNAD